MRVWVVLVCLLVSSQVQAKPSVLFRVLGVGYLVTSVVDATQTVSMADRRELNPVMRPIADSPVALGAVKVLVPLGFNAWTERIRGQHPRLALGLRVMAVSVQTAVVIRASRQH
jgi:hypothetical protein